MCKEFNFSSFVIALLYSVRWLRDTELFFDCRISFFTKIPKLCELAAIDRDTGSSQGGGPPPFGENIF